MVPGVKLNRLLESLAPQDSEELSLLRTLVRYAQLMLRGAHIDLSLSQSQFNQVVDSPFPSLEIDIRRFLELIPESSKKYLHGLIEALDIYQSVHGVPLSPQSLRLDDSIVYELRELRDMCLQDGLRSIY